MRNYALPNGIERGDSFVGTIVGTSRTGVYIRFTCQDIELDAFAPAGGVVGDEVMITALWYTKSRNSYRVGIDSYLSYSADKKLARSILAAA